MGYARLSGSINVRRPDDYGRVVPEYEVRVRILLLTSLLFVSVASAADNWPSFRGPTQMGHANGAGLPVTWSETQNVKWKTGIPGEGWSSPVIWGNQVWMTTATDNAKSLRAICVNKETGDIIHDVEVFAPPVPEPKNNFNSHASPTPVIEEGRVYVSFGNYGNACLDTATGKPIWKTQELKLDHKEGPGSSPILYKNLFILDCDGIDVQYIAALDKQTGRIVWKVKRSYDLARLHFETRKAYCTPIIIQIDGQDWLISVGAKRIYCYDPADGRELWYCDHPGFSVAPRPVFGHGMIYIATGYMKAELFAVKVANAKGDVSKTHVAWKSTQNVPLKPSVLLIGDELYTVNDAGIGRCYDAKTGEVLWQKRLTQATSAAPLYAGGHIYVFNERGESIVFKPGRAEPPIVATNTLQAGCLASPAVSGNAMFVRTRTHLYRIEQ